MGRVGNGIDVLLMQCRLLFPNTPRRGVSIFRASQTTDQELLTTCRSFPIPRTKPDAPAEIRGPCRTNHQDSVPVAARHELRAASRPVAFTAHYEPVGRTHGSAPHAR